MKLYNKIEIFLGIFLILIIGVITVEITNFHVPEHIVITDETPDDIKLDCEYELEDGETNLVVKWLKDSEIIYQWIQGRPPKAFPNVRMEIDEGYEASDDELQKYRALVIKNPHWNVTGKYKCLVQTKQSASKMESHLQVIDVSNLTFSLIEEDDDEEDEDVEIKCSVENIFPQPKLRIKNGEENVHIKSEEFSRKNNGYYDVSAVGILKHTERGDNGFSCSLYVPGSNFTYVQTTSSGNTFKYFSSLLPVSIGFLIVTFCT
ncbi:uncharacterized protein LOC129612256 isoform X2 [Condylostylus longicornis]|uniref:uncharacterized protein LOC129612256 isoform X2 n=1 Tax=Condylostylus longicornis TaxID=2530218 RepID=UPI00244E2219|nr:uncharacterized protein LOC129612256 isoform X2 [Condylostylus longicornis]